MIGQIRTMRVLTVLAVMTVVVNGCERGGDQQGTGSGASGVLPTGFFLSSPPAGYLPVDRAKESASVGSEIAVQGRIGGSVHPFVSGRAVFTIVGPGLKDCSQIPGDNCRTPWDYCCDSREDLAKHSATIQITDESGQPLRFNVRGQGGLKEQADVVVAGRVVQRDGPVLVIAASGIYVNPRD